MENKEHKLMSFVPGCAIFFNMEKILQIGFFDENFFGNILAFFGFLKQVLSCLFEWAFNYYLQYYNIFILILN